MYLNYKTSIFFLSFLALKEVFSSELSLENDITKPMDEWISSIFTIEAVTQDDYQKQFGPRIGLDVFDTANHYTINKFKYDIYDGNCFEKRIYFEKIRVNENQDKWTQNEPVHIDWNFNKNKLRVFVKKITFDVSGKLSTGNTITNIGYKDFIAYLYLKNFTLTAVESNSSLITNTSNQTKISYNISCDEFNSSFGSEQKILPVFPPMLVENFNHNTAFYHSLERFFKYFVNPKKEIISKHPNLPSKSQEFYYLIPKYNFLRFSLNRIVIRGISNLVSIKILAQMFPRHGKITLHIENLEGSMILDYETTKENCLEMHFQIGSLRISKIEDTQCVHVQARYCHIARAETNNSLSIRQLEIMKSGLELAIANSLLLPVQAKKVCDQETPLEDIQIIRTSDWNSVKEFYKDWIPFNEEKTSDSS